MLFICFWRDLKTVHSFSVWYILIGQKRLNFWSHDCSPLCLHLDVVPMLSTMSVCFEFVPWKNKSCVWSQSRDMDSYIFHAFRNNFLFCSVNLSLTAFTLTLSFSALPSERPTAPDNSKQLDRNTTAKHERTYSLRNVLVLMKLVHLISFNTLNFPWTLRSPHTYRHTFSLWPDTYFTAMYFLVFTHTYPHIRICKQDLLLFHFLS